MIDVLCAMFSGAPFGPNIPKMYGDLHQHRRLGGLVGAINISAFTSLEEFRQRVSAMAGGIGQLKAASTVSELNVLASAATVAPLEPVPDKTDSGGVDLTADARSRGSKSFPFPEEQSREEELL